MGRTTFERGAHGERLASYLHLPAVRTVRTRMFGSMPAAVTECRLDVGRPAHVAKIPPEPAFLINLQLADCGPRVVSIDDTPIEVAADKAGNLLFHDLRRGISAEIGSTFHTVSFYLPQSALDHVADDVRAPAIEALSPKPGAAIADRTLAELIGSYLPGLARPDKVSQLFVDNLALAIIAHVAQVYGDLRPGERIVRGGLAPWQEKRAKDLIAADLNGRLGVADIARECRLSASQFSRAFRQSTGQPPHQWLMQRRVDAAKALLLMPDLPLADIGLACGFADQSHFTRVFSREMGASPGHWRRVNATAGRAADPA